MTTPAARTTRATRVFTLSDQSAFAALSGDENPLHVDPVAARRTSFGGCVVHGLHLVLWALDLASHREDAAHRLVLERLTTVFRQPVRVGDEATCEIEIDEGAGSIAAKIQVAGRAVARIQATLASDATAAHDVALPAEVPATKCRERSFAEAASAAGHLALGIDRRRLEAGFPSLAAALPLAQIAELCALTRLVGMECPGLRSMFAEIDVARRLPAGRSALELSWAVEAADERFSHLRMKVDGPTLSGRIKAFYRPAPQAQVRASELAPLVRRGELAGRRVLVVGGSRGLGEVAAKLAGVAGADVAITYHRGREDAERVALEIESAGGRCRTFAFDVLAAPEDVRRALEPLLGNGWAPTDLWYFATPFIAIDDGRRFAATRFATFCRYYVEGFESAVSAIRARDASGPLEVLFPSTVFLDDAAPPAGAAEYCAAKAAGEVLCRDLERRFAPLLRVAAPRLPRMPTDQTLGLLPVTASAPETVLLGVIRQLGSRAS